MRKLRLLLNTSTSLLLKIITIVCGFILPRFMLQAFGSEINGLVNSIVQFLSIITFLELGVGTVVESALYKPLAEKDLHQINCIVTSAHKFFNRLACIFFVYLCILTVAYPVFFAQSFDVIFTASLIIILSIKSFAENYIGIVDELLLSADQQNYVSDLLHIGTILLNTVTCVILIRCNQSVHVIKLVAAGISMLVPACRRYYISKKYILNRRTQYQKEPIAQKWNGIAQHVAAVVTDSTDNIVLTFLSTLQNVSIYSVYNLIAMGIRQLAGSLIDSSQALMGELWARQEHDELNDVFEWAEWSMHTAVIFLFGCTMVLITPFVQVYTEGVSDANYYQPLFGVLLSLAHCVYCLKYPYITLVFAVGHYKQTQRSYIITTIINLVISVIMVWTYGLIGVAIGTLAAMLYHFVWMAVYVFQNLLKRPFSGFVKQVLVDLIILLSAGGLSSGFTMNAVSYFAWFLLAVKVAVVWLFVILATNGIFYREKMGKLLKHLKRAEQ